MASLFVIQGADQGKRFEFKSKSRGPGPGQLERRSGSTIPRSPAATPRCGQSDDAYRIVDLGSANGTFVNGQPDRPGRRCDSGDRLQLGQTVMLFHDGGDRGAARPDGAGRPAGAEQPRRPLGDPPEHPRRARARAVLQAPDAAGGLAQATG